jgi:hypothetical protein
MTQNNNQKVEPAQKPERKPNDTAGFYFSSGIKITDPETGQVLLHKRAD